MRKTFKNEIGITLIALVVTIVVLLILAGVSIAMLTGENGIITRATQSKTENAHAEVKEKIMLEYQDWKIAVETTIAEETTFQEWLEGKEYISNTGIINTSNLLEHVASYGNGTSIAEGDVYELKLEGSIYVLRYYEKPNDSAPVELVTLPANINEMSSIFITDGNGTITGLTDEGKQLSNIVVPSKIGDEEITCIGDSAFVHIEVPHSITLPNTITDIEGRILGSEIQELNFQGTMEEWNNINKDSDWNWFGYSAIISVVHCSDGDVAI